MATHNVPPVFAEARGSSPFQPGPMLLLAWPSGQNGRVHILILRLSAYAERRAQNVSQPSNLAAYRTWLIVPMLKEDELLV